jgi:general stress protein 26
MDETQAYAEVWRKIRPIRFAMLTCRDASGDLTSRPMTTVQDDFSGALWFFTSRRAPVIAAHDRDGAVNLAYAEPRDDVYVSLSGTASIDHDRERRKALWNVMVKAWFPQGIDDPDLVLLRVDVHSAEYWDVKESRAVQMFKLTRAILAGERPELGEHATVSLGSAA